MSKRKYNNRRESVITDFLFNFAMIAGFLAVLVALIIFLHKDMLDLPGSSKEPGSNHYEIDLGNNDDSSSSSSPSETTPPDGHGGTDRPAVLDIPEDAYFAISNVNIRSEASTSSDKLGKLQKYDYVVVDSIENGWAKIVYESSETGFAYVSDDYLTKDDAFAEEAKAHLLETAAEEAFLSDSIVDKTSSTYTSEALLEDLNELQTKYPDSLSYETVGTTDEDNDIYYITLGNKEAEKKILVYGSATGDTDLPQLLIACQIEYYLDSLNYWYDKSGDLTYKNILDNVAICFIPDVNPDGTDELSEDELTTLNNISGMADMNNYIKYFSDSKDFSLNTEEEPTFNENAICAQNSLPASNLYNVWRHSKETAIMIACELVES